VVPLETYRKLRDFRNTSEPRGKVARKLGARFAVQEHHASQLHYDFRLEIGGVLKSWAVPKGPSLDPRQKHLAVQVEDHPIDYLHFEGEIEPGNYGAGKVLVWDSGTFEPVDAQDLKKGLASGKLNVILHGKKLRGQFNLVRLKDSQDQWLLIKSNDEYAVREWKLEPKLKTKPPKPTRTKSSRGKTKRVIPVRAKSKARPLAAAQKETLNFERGPTKIAIPNLERTPMPQAIQPMLATLVDKPFSDPSWIFENKWDGVRALCFIENGRTRFISRTGKEMGNRYPELAGINKSIHASSVILDGEIVVLNERGQPSFQLLQSRVALDSQADIQRRSQEQRLVYYIFDLLYFDGFNLTSSPLAERKKLLEAIVEANDHVQISEHTIGKGEELFERARARQQEGIIAKDASSPYIQGRSGRWLKLKTTLQQEVVIGGYTKPRNTREHFGALVVGLYRDGKLVSVGHVGSGFDRELLKQLRDQMQPFKTRKSPFAVEPGTNEPVQWIKPALVCQVKFAEWTRDRQMRQPIFLRLRDDKSPSECTFESPRPAEKENKQAKAISKANKSMQPEPSAAGAISLDEFIRATDLEEAQVAVDGVAVKLTHLEITYFPKDGITKGDLLRYYASVAPVMLPYLRHRPLILKRYPRGINGPFFFQHDLASAPAFVRRQPLKSDSGRVIEYAVIDNTATLLYLAHLGTIEIHPWHSRVEDLNHPDWFELDLDPMDADFGIVCQAAQGIRETLEQFNLRGYPVTSGSRGIHIFVPIEPRYDYERVIRLAQDIAVIAGKEHPESITLSRAYSQRARRHIYIDYGQNVRGKAMAAAYTVRARPGATVSAPLDWDEIKPGLKLHQFTVKTVPARVRERGDLFQGVLEHPQKLDEALAEMARRNKSQKSK
jgi:bifunctional non-homologous end joining protein LigD